MPQLVQSRTRTFVAAERGTAGTASTGLASAGAASTGLASRAPLQRRELGELLVGGVAVVDRRRARGARGVPAPSRPAAGPRACLGRKLRPSRPAREGKMRPPKPGAAGAFGLPRLGSGSAALGAASAALAAGPEPRPPPSRTDRARPARPPLRPSEGGTKLG